RNPFVPWNPPLWDVNPPRVLSQRRELKSRMISDGRARLGEPDGRRVLDDRLVGGGEGSLSFGGIERRERAVHVRIEHGILVGPVVAAARRARSPYSPRPEDRAR